MTEKENILERWAEFYEELYNDTDSSTSMPDFSEEDVIPPILSSEVEEAIKHLKIGKSPGLDNIYSEYLKAGGEPLMNALLHLFLKIQETGKVPQKFKDALIVVLCKKNSRLDCGNYRPISLLSHIISFLSVS